MRTQARIGLLLVFILLAFQDLPTFRHWFSLRGEMLMRVDYSLYYASALQGLTAGWDKLYDLDVQRAVFARIGSDLWWFPNVYTPVLSLVMVPFTALSLDAGYRLWSALMLTALVLGWYLLSPGDRPLRGVQLAMLFLPYPVALGLWMGQIVSFQVAAIAFCYVLLRRGRDRSAGMVLAAIALKPQGLFLVPFALLIAGKRRVFLSWLACMAAIGLVVLAFIGANGAMAYAQRILYAQAHPQEFWVNWSYTLLRRFEGGTKILVQLTVAAAAMLASFRNRKSTELVIAAGILGSLLVTPFVHLDDFVLLFPAAWLVLRASPSVWTAVFLLLGYGALYLCGRDEHVWARWVLLFECLWLAWLAAGRARSGPTAVLVQAEPLDREAALSAARGVSREGIPPPRG